MKDTAKGLIDRSVVIAQRVFRTEDGKELMRILEHYYTNPVFVPDPYTTAYKLGAHDLVRDLKRMVAVDLEK